MQDALLQDAESWASTGHDIVGGDQDMLDTHGLAAWTRDSRCRGLWWRNLGCLEVEDGASVADIDGSQVGSIVPDHAEVAEAVVNDGLVDFNVQPSAIVGSSRERDDFPAVARPRAGRTGGNALPGIGALRVAILGSECGDGGARVVDDNEVACHLSTENKQDTSVNRGSKTSMDMSGLLLNWLVAWRM